MESIALEALKVAGGAIALAAALIPYHLTIVKEAKNLKAKARNHRHALSWVHHFGKNGWVIESIHEAHRETHLDRFLLLTSKSVKGGAPTHCDAVYQLRDGSQHFVNYEDYPLDEAYQEILINLKTGSPHYRFQVEQHKPCSLRTTYMSEGVTDSLLSLIYYEQTTGTYIYCSHATHHEDGLDDMAIHKAEVIVGAMQLHAMQYAQGDKNAERKTD